MEQQTIENEVNTAVSSLIDQFAEIKFEGMFMYAVLLVAALVICLEGYHIYRLALMLMGFAVGYVQVHYFLDFFHISLKSDHKLMVQAIVGVICAIVSTSVVKLGVFLAAYYFAKYALAAPIAGFILRLAGEKISVPEFLVPSLTSIIGLAAAYFIAKIAANSLRLVIVVLTAAVGGFSLVGSFIGMIPYFPVDLSFMPQQGSVVWAAAKLFMTAAGVGIQGIKGE